MSEQVIDQSNGRRLYQSLSEVQAGHLDLIQQIPELKIRDPEAACIVAVFVRRVVTTGAVLDLPDDRLAAQALIDFWSSQLARSAVDVELARNRTRLPDLGDTLLDAFDLSGLQTLVAATDAALNEAITKEPAFGEVLRAVLLGFARLPDGELSFVTVIRSRAELLASGPSDYVATVLQLLEDQGILTRLPNASRDTDLLQLTPAALLRHWPRLVQWLDQRAMFREAALFWDKHKRVTDALFRGVIDDSPWRDMNALEQDFLAACRGEERRLAELHESELSALHRRATVLLFLIAVITALTATVYQQYVKTTQFNEKLTRKSKELARNVVALQDKQLALEQKKSLETSSKYVVTHLVLSDNAFEAHVGRQLMVLGLLAHIAFPDDPKNGDEVKEARDNWMQLKLDLTKRSTGLPFPDNVFVCEMTATNEDFSPMLDRFETLEDEKSSSDARQEALFAISNRMRDVYVASKHRGEYEKLLTTIRSKWYAMGYAAAKRITEGAKSGRPYEELESFINTFWRLYWGEMVLMESEGVEAAMVRFGNPLLQWQREATSPDGETPVDLRAQRASTEVQKKLAYFLDELGEQTGSKP